MPKGTNEQFAAILSLNQKISQIEFAAEILFDLCVNAVLVLSWVNRMSQLQKELIKQIEEITDYVRILTV